MKKELFRFIRSVRLEYLIFTSLLIFGVIVGGFEIIQRVFFSDTPATELQWLHLSRGLLLALAMSLWAAWTVYSYRGIYQDKLDVTEARYRDIIENSADAIIALDTDDRIISWNRGAERLFGWDREEIIGEPAVHFIPPKLIQNGELEKIESEMREKGHVSSFETERLNRRGNTVPVNLTQSNIRNEKGQIIGRSQILRDLTDLKIREKQFQHSERLASVGHMAAGVAHEVGNPLTAISSLVQVCQRKTDDPFLQDQLRKVREHINRISKIVRDLVDFSRPSGIETSAIRINQIVKAAVGLLKHDARCRDVNFRLDLSPSLPRLYGVPDHIHQVLVNLLLNAVDAMEQIEDPQVVIRTWWDGDLLRCSITDVGTGIPPEVRQRIFEPFFTTKEVGRGTGLGLSVSHGIIAKMGGTITVNSVEGEETTFVITLPLKNNRS